MNAIALYCCWLAAWLPNNDDDDDNYMFVNNHRYAYAGCAQSHYSPDSRVQPLPNTKHSIFASSALASMCVFTAAATVSAPVLWRVVSRCLQKCLTISHKTRIFPYECGNFVVTHQINIGHFTIYYHYYYNLCCKYPISVQCIDALGEVMEYAVCGRRTDG